MVAQPQKGTFQHQAPETAVSGPQVLWARPGQLVLLSAILMGVVWAVDVFLISGAPESSEPDVPAVVLPSVTEALTRAEVEDQGQVGPLRAAPDQPKQGLVNLFAHLTEENVPEEGATGSASEAKGKEKEPPAAGKGKAVPEGFVAIEDPKGVMEPFYRALAQTEAKQPGALTRISQYGDSIIVSDFITSSARRRFQEKFGDGGHGFVLIDKPWDYYRHFGVRHSADFWKLSRITSNTIQDHQYGLGGVTSRTWGPGAWAQFSTASKGEQGRALSRFQLFYRAQPKGGNVAILVDGKEVELIETAAEAVEDKVHSLSIKDGPHKVRVQSKGGGEVRLFGAVLERETPGVVYDSLGITGIRAKTLGRFDGAHFQRQLALRDSDLVVVMIGTNESEFTGMSMEDYAADYARLLQRIRKGLPQKSCLVASPPDRAKKNSKGKLTTIPLLKKIIETQRKVALEQGCAFWNTYEAMGGENSMVAWYRHNPRLGSGDFTHFTKAGGDALGVLLFDALMHGYKQSK